MRLAAPIALGLLLAALPFVRYRFAAPHPTAHANHEARHGGTVVMSGDLHLEIVSDSRGVAIHASDPWRRPLPVRQVRVRVGEEPWQNLPAGRTTQRLDPERRWEISAELEDGRSARVRLPPRGRNDDA